MDTGTTAFMLCCIIGLTMMIPGLALFYGGMVSVKSSTNMMMMTFGAVAIVGVLWADLRAGRHRSLPRPAPGARGRRRRAAPRRACSMPPTRSRSTPSSTVGWTSWASPRSSRRRSSACPAGPVRAFESLYEADREAREMASELIAVRTRQRAVVVHRDLRPRHQVLAMSWLLAFLGLRALIILHEFGHFAAAKATGMRVERFTLFFPPLLARSAAARPSTPSGRCRSAAT